MPKYIAAAIASKSRVTTVFIIQLATRFITIKAIMMSSNSPA